MVAESQSTSHRIVRVVLDQLEPVGVPDRPEIEEGSLPLEVSAVGFPPLVAAGFPPLVAVADPNAAHAMAAGVMATAGAGDVVAANGVGVHVTTTTTTEHR